MVAQAWSSFRVFRTSAKTLKWQIITRITPILTILGKSESSWPDLSFETHFVFWELFFVRRFLFVAGGCRFSCGLGLGLGLSLGLGIGTGFVFSHPGGACPQDEEKTKTMPRSRLRPRPRPQENLHPPSTTKKRCTTKKSLKTKCVSNDGSGHDDSNRPRIVKIGAILAFFGHFKVFADLRKTRKLLQAWATIKKQKLLQAETTSNPH